MSKPSLHTVNKPALSNGALLSCLRVTQADDCILLMEDGVYSIPLIAAAKQATALSTQEAELKVLLDQHALRICALEEDLKARGISLGSLPKAIEVVNYAGFVKLVVDYPKSVSWF
jgi:sulfur relay protein TusB/DsrH